jgi:cytochrome P450
MSSPARRVGIVVGHVQAKIEEDRVHAGFSSTSLRGPSDDKVTYKQDVKGQRAKSTEALPTSSTEDGSWRSVLMDFGVQFLEGTVHKLIEEWSGKYADGANFWYPQVASGVKGVFPAICVCDLEDAIRLLKNHVQKPNSYSALMIGDGVLSQENNDSWLRQRNQLKPAFSTKVLLKLLPMIKEGVTELCERIGAVLGESGEGEIDMHAELMRMAFLMIGHAALGRSTDFVIENAEKVQAAFEYSMCNPFPGWKETEEGKVHVRVMEDFSKDVFVRNQVEFSSESIAGRLEDAAYGASDNLKRDELMTFMVSGL